MPWTKSDDGSATHPVVVAPAASGDPRLINELYGFVMRLAHLCAKDLTDYHVNYGMAYQCAPHDPAGMMALAVRWGYAEPVPDSDPPAWRLIEHDGLFHNRSKAEIDWEKSQRKDTRDRDLVAAVLFRDGDACRCCNVITSRKSRTGTRQATMWNRKEDQTLEHLEPGEAANSPDDLVNLCYACNSARRDRPNADLLRPIQPAPAKPFYTEYTAALLREAGYKVRKSGESRRPRRIPFSTASDSAPSGTTPTTTTAQRPGNSTQTSAEFAPDNAEQTIPAVRPDSQSDTAATSTNAPERPPPQQRRVPDLGSPGRDGKGREGSGTGSPGSPPRSSRPARKRKPRSKPQPKEKS